MARATLGQRLDRLVDAKTDHVLGPDDADITLVEYGSYACPYCRAANEQIAEVRDQFGDRLRYVFRHKPLAGSDLARPAAELVERIDDPPRFWKAHIELMTRSETLTEDDLSAVADKFGLGRDNSPDADRAISRAKARVEADERSARASNVTVTPTFFINGRRYDGTWDARALSEALLGTLGHRVQSAAVDFARWGPSAGILLVFATILAIALTNSPAGEAFNAFWAQSFGLVFDGADFRMSLRDWVNDGLLTIFFLVVGLEIKREFTVGRLATRRSAALPVAGAIGGMLAPAALYLLIIPSGPWARGWGIPMSTDTAFAVALMVLLGTRVPVELRIFLTAAAIVDDLGAILALAIFYSGQLHFAYLVLAAGILVALALLNHARVYLVTPYILLGVALWACIFAGGLHSTLAGVLLAMFIPTRPPPNLRALTAQADAIFTAEARRGGEVLRQGPSEQALRALDTIHERLESPADRLLRHAGARSSYVLLPLFALANAGVALSTQVIAGHEPLMLAIVAGLVVGKPIGLLAFSGLAVGLGIAVKPEQYSWRQLAGAGGLAGIGFTMSLFIAGYALPATTDFEAAKIAVFVASILSAIVGVAILCTSENPTLESDRA
jgi:NhaA family Na+:H+ antiporter